MKMQYACMNCGILFKNIKAKNKHKEDFKNHLIQGNRGFY